MENRAKAIQYLEEWLKYSAHAIEEPLYSELVDLIIYVIKEEN